MLRTRVLIGVAALLAGAAGVGAFASPAAAAGTDVYVLMASDGGTDTLSGGGTNNCTSAGNPCATIAHAVAEAGTGGVVHVNDGRYVEHVSVTTDVTIEAFHPGQVTLDGPDDQTSATLGLYNRTGPFTVTLHSINIFGNNEIDDAVDVDAGVTLLVDQSTIGNAFGYGIYGPRQATVTLSESELTNNNKAGILLGAGSSIAIDNSRISTNSGGGVIIDARTKAGPNDENTSLTLSNSLVQFNRTVGVYNRGATVSIQTSTINANQPYGVLARYGGTLTMSNSTVTGTRPTDTDDGAGVGSVDDDSSIAVQSTIVAGQDGSPDCYGTIDDEGYNLSSDADDSCDLDPARHSIVQRSAKLAPQDGALNIGLLKGSPALDRIPDGVAGCSTGSTDQRGAPRLSPVGAKCDLGAIEMQGRPVVISTSSLPKGTVGRAYKAQLYATGGQFPSYVWSLKSGSTLPSGLTLSSKGLISGTPRKAGRFTTTVSVNDPVLKTYTITISSPAAGAVGPVGAGAPPAVGGSAPTSPAPGAGSGSGSATGGQSVAETGTDTLTLTTTGTGAIGVGLLVLLAAGVVGRRPGRHRASTRP